MSFDPTFKISERRKEIETGIANSLAHVEKLRKELLELEVAERVLMRLYDLPLLTQTEPPAETTSSPSNASEHRKPHGLPTISAMILELLEDARKAGKGGITPTDLTDLVQLKWWPGATSVIVGPGAWRLWKAGKLEKDEGGRYRLPSRATMLLQKIEGGDQPSENEGPDAEASEPS